MKCVACNREELDKQGRGRCVGGLVGVEMLGYLLRFVTPAKCTNAGISGEVC